MKTKKAKLLPKHVQESLKYKPSARTELSRIEWSEDMTSDHSDSGFYFEAVYDRQIGGSNWGKGYKSVEHRLSIILRGWCPHVQYK